MRRDIMGLGEVKMDSGMCFLTEYNRCFISKNERAIGESCVCAVKRLCWEILAPLYLLTRKKVISLRSGHFRTSPTHCVCGNTNLLIFFSSDTNNGVPKFDLSFRVDRASGIKFY